MDRKSGVNRPPYVAIGCEAAAIVAARQREREEAIAARDADMAQSPVDGLNRTVSIKQDTPLLAALDQSKTDHKSLCGHDVIHTQCEAALVMEEAGGQRDAAQAMHEAEQRGSAAAIDDADQYDAGVATDNTGQSKSEVISDAEQCGAGVDNDTRTVQGPVSELNRTVSIEKDEFVPVKLDKAKIKSKSLKERIRGLSFVRKIVGFFKKLFRSGKVIDSDSKKGGETIVSALAAGSGKLPVDSEEGRIQEANSLFNDVNELGKAIAVEDPPFNDWENARTSIKDLHRKLSRLVASLEEEGGLGHLDEKMAQIKMGIDWITFHVRDSKSDDNYVGRNMRYYNAVLTCHYDAAKVALEDSDPAILRQLENCYQQSELRIKNEVNNGNAFAAMHNLEIFNDDALRLVDSVDQRDKYKQEFFKRQPVRVPGIKKQLKQAESLAETDPMKPKQ